MTAQPGTLAWLSRATLAGAINALTSLAIVVTLGLVAFAPLGAAAAREGIAASFATVIAGGLVYAWRGSVAFPTGGPSSATALIVAGLGAQLARDPVLNLASAPGLGALTAVVATSVMLMGLLQIAFALLGLARLARFVPQPVLAGFMNGVALMILVTQVPALLGLPPLTSLGDASAQARTQALTLAVGLGTCRYRLAGELEVAPSPGAVACHGRGYGSVYLLSATLPGLALGPTVGPLPQGMVWPEVLMRLPGADALALLQRHAGTVVLTAGVLAVIGSLESLLGAVAIDQSTHTRHNSRRELLALGMANRGQRQLRRPAAGAFARPVAEQG